MTTTRSTLSPEARLLLSTAAMPPDGAAVRAALSGSIDWEYFRALALHEKAASVVVSEFGRLGLAPPDPEYRELQQAARVSVMQMLQLEHLLHQAVDTLAERGIEAMLLKGAGLAFTAYPSFADRPMSDLDVLVRPEDAERAWGALQTRGWTWPSERWSAERYTAHHHLPPLVRNPGGFRIEIHTDLLPGGHPFAFAPAALWKEMRLVRVDGRELGVPHPVHQLWHACVHFAWSHQMEWGTWRTLRDCAAISAGSAVDWEEFMRFAVDSRAGTTCYWTLRLAQRLVGAQVPREVLVELRPARAEFLLERLERHYVCSLFPSMDHCPSVWLSQQLWIAGILPARSGHGSARPWQTTERWLAGGEPGEGMSAPSPGAKMRIRNFGAWFNYLRRIHRFSLPPGTTHTGSRESSHAISQ